MAIDNIITGLSYPLEISEGNLKISSNENLIRQHILSWLETFKNERVEPDYGIKMYVGKSQNKSVIESEIFNDLLRNIPDTRFNVKVTDNDTGDLLITVEWATDQFETAPSVIEVLLSV